MHQVQSQQILETCYACDEPFVSRDHVPPQVFYPEKKDIGIDLRSNLITVPSCKRHNEHASVSDELAAYAIVVSMTNNRIAMNQFSTKVMRALKRSQHIQDLYFDSLRWMAIGTRRRPAFSINRTTPDSPVYEFACHFDRTMEKIARGLYFHIFKRRLEHDAPLNIHSPHLFSEVSPTEVMALNSQTTQRMLRYQWQPVKVPHRDVFECVYWTHPRFLNQIIFWFRFYQGFQVWVSSEGILAVMD